MGSFGGIMNSDIEIRLAEIDDLAAIFHLGEKVFTPQEVSNLYRTWDEYEVTGLFNSEPDYLLVAEAEDRVVGFAMGTTIEKSRSAWNYGHLLWLGVDPDFARMGAGSLLFDRFREIMEKKSVRMLMVDTQADNDAAIRFFSRKGFENPTDHIYMTLNLQKEDS
jgi:ribosomal protein S18 acetylase RimI-like enzyme